MSGGKEPLSFLNQSQDHLSGKSMNYLLREFGTEDVDAIYELTSQPDVYKIFARLVFYKGAVPPIGSKLLKARDNTKRNRGIYWIFKCGHKRRTE